MGPAGGRLARLGSNLTSCEFRFVKVLASPALADIHSRQPAVLDPSRFDNWLDPASPVPRLLELVREPCAGPYETRPVSTRVNSVQNDDPGIPVPVSEKRLI